MIAITFHLSQTLELPERYIEGKLIAVESLCKTIIRRNDFPIPEDYLIQFYSCLHQLLKSENEVKILSYTDKSCFHTIALTVHSQPLLFIIILA